MIFGNSLMPALPFRAMFAFFLEFQGVCKSLGLRFPFPSASAAGWMPAAYPVMQERSRASQIKLPSGVIDKHREWRKLHIVSRTMTRMAAIGKSPSLQYKARRTVVCRSCLLIVRDFFLEHHQRQSFHINARPAPAMKISPGVLPL